MNGRKSNSAYHPRPPVDKLLELALGFIRGKRKGLELRGEDDLKWQVGAKPDPIQQMRLQLLVGPVNHALYQGGAVEGEYAPASIGAA